MRFEVSDEQRQLAEMVGDVLTEVGTPRASYDSGSLIDTALYGKLAELGLTNLLLAAERGGTGGAMLDQVLVAEQIGGHAGAIPITTVAAAGWLLSDLPGRAVDTVCERIAGGAVVGIGLSAAAGLDLDLRATARGESFELTGSVGDLIEGAVLDSVVVAAVDEDGQRGWYALDAGATGVTRTPQPSLDQGQPLASLTCAGSPALHLGHATDAARTTSLDVARLVLAAQALGAADRALQLTVTYASERKAFGQPIGRFQAIKHRAADMLVRVENSRSAVYNAAWAYDEKREDVDVATHMAKAVAAENAVSTIHDAIQSHGGIGYTWEHDLHLLLRRAKTAQLVLGTPEELYERIAATLLDRGMVGRSPAAVAAPIIEAAGDREFHEEFSTWLDEHVPDGWGTPDFRLPREPDARRAFWRSWQATMASGNWVGIHWPTEFGGRSATLSQQIAYNAELLARRLPALPGHRGLTIVGPTLIKHGTAEQQARYLEPIRTGAELWAGGFSEPDAGSDLAGLRTRGEIDGDEIRVNGQKIWTSSAHWCDYIYTLVRTDPSGPRHESISVVAIPLSAPGVTVRPIKNMAGTSEFNEVFFDDVTVPVANIIGPVNGGWQVNRTTLSHEHFTLFIGAQVRFAQSLAQVVDLAHRSPRSAGRTASDDPFIRQRIARSWVVSQLLMINGMRNVAKVQVDGGPGPEGSISKLFGQESEKDLFELAIDIAGPAGVLDRGADDAVDNGKWLFGYLKARAATIGGGTSEIHRNKIGEGVLGLPRDLGLPDGA